MGIPQHYSQELPERCLHLIEALLPTVKDVEFPGKERLGPLTTTFLLAMSTPIITLPIERVERHRQKAAQGHEGYMDDRPLAPELACAVDAALGSGPLKESPFFLNDDWRFASTPYKLGTNLARSFPNDLSRKLSMPDALRDASEMPASQWASCLRNAFAHGGIIYLDKDGRQSFGQTADMLAFVSAKYPEGDFSQPPAKLKVLQITEADFLTFLRRWVGWLQSSGFSRAHAA